MVIWRIGHRQVSGSEVTFDGGALAVDLSGAGIDCWRYSFPEEKM
jgi:hypothetical protein